MPAPLRGPGRDALWRRMQVRRLLSVLLVAAAVAVVADRAFPGQVVPMVDVVVATRDLVVGHHVTSSDLTRRSWPAELVPDSWPRETTVLVGRRLNGPVGNGEPVLMDRVGSSTMARGSPVGSRLVHVPLAEPGVMQHLAVGDRVDLLAASSGVLVADAAHVVALSGGGSTAGDEAGLGLEADAPPPGLLVLVDQATAARLAVSIGASEPGEGVVVSVIPGDGVLAAGVSPSAGDAERRAT